MTVSLAGAMAGLEALFIGIGLVVATVFSRTHRLRSIVVIALTVLMLANFACVIRPDVQSLFVLRSITGAMSGVIVWAVTSVLIRTEYPGRITGYFVATYTALQGASVLLLALYLMAIFDWRSGFLLMGLASVLALVLASKLPQGLVDLPKTIKAKLKFSFPVMLTCLIVVLQLVAFMSIWTFLEPIGELGGESTQTVQVVLSVSLFVQVLGAAAGGYFADKLSSGGVLAVASAFIMLIGFYFLKITPETGHLFLVAGLSFSFVWMLILPFHTQLAIEIDPSGNLALNIPILQILGSVAAPVFGGALALGGDIRDVMLLTLACSIAALSLTVVVTVLRKR